MFCPSFLSVPASLRLLCAVLLLPGCLTGKVLGQAPQSPAVPAPALPNNAVPQVVPTPPTVPAAPGSPAGTLNGAEADGDAIAAPPPPPAVWSRQTFSIAPCAEPPKIDGRLDDPCWKAATKGRGFYRIGGGTPSAQQTEVSLCADQTHLYIAFRCLDSHPELIQSSMTQRTGAAVLFRRGDQPLSGRCE